MGSLIDVLAKSDKLKAMADALKIAGMVQMLSSDGPFTILAPNDEAVAQVPRSYFNSLLENKEKLTKAVKYHIIPEKLTTEDLENMLKRRESAEVESMEGHSLEFRSIGNLKPHFTVNGATIVSTGFEADNGLIYIIDAVLFVKNKI